MRTCDVTGARCCDAVAEPQTAGCGRRAAVSERRGIPSNVRRSPGYDATGRELLAPARRDRRSSPRRACASPVEKVGKPLAMAEPALNPRRLLVASWTSNVVVAALYFGTALI